MTDPWRSAKITRCEQVPAAPSVTLLRIEARESRWRSGDATPPPILLADDGESVNRFAPLPAAPDERGMLRIAYSVPADAIAPQTVFSLRLADGSVLSLPRPTIGAPWGDETTPATAEPPAAHAQDESERLAAERDEAVRAAEALRQENERLQATVDELEVWRGELERRLAATTTELGTARTRLRENEQELGRLRAGPAPGRPQAPVQGESGATGSGTLSSRAAEVAALLRAADRVADAARELTEARARLTDTDTTPATAAATAPAPPTEASALDPDDLMRRAAAEASERAARELAEALGDGS